MQKYEGLFIFPKRIGEEALEAALDKVRETLEENGCRVLSMTRLGKRNFARPLKKHTGGHYVVFEFDAEGERIAELHSRFKLNSDVLRQQFIKVGKEGSKPTAARQTEQEEAS